MATELPAIAESQREILAFQYELLLEARRREELLPYVTKMYDEYIAAAQRECERAGFEDGETVGRVLFAALDGMVLQQVVFGHREHTEDGVALVHEAFKALLAQRRRRRR